ncbi:hypothetical protein MIT9_P0047 [Methylomarinovum caldicuralii]|uniref:Uncharacterized protein n=1 Tax=Methylomarinovum caldicuralii TaxID=438856 RepID=A0AAU9C3W2_9GAMM|nr:hypothetical protein [Methylomarinovum caldicuralii]BCX80474.1 hypothetical protein MIT9_P0047 [Methylomarinovum caldicuralii]
MNATTWILAAELGLLLILIPGGLLFLTLRRKRRQDAALEALLNRLETTLPQRRSHYQEWLQRHLALDESNADAIASQWLEAERQFWHAAVATQLRPGPEALGKLPDPFHRCLDRCLESLSQHLSPSLSAGETEEAAPEEAVAELLVENTAAPSPEDDPILEDDAAIEVFSDTPEAPEETPAGERASALDNSTPGDEAEADSENEHPETESTPAIATEADQSEPPSQ